MLEEALVACEFWQSKIPAQPDIQVDEGRLSLLLHDFIRYPFSAPLSGLKKALLVHIAESAWNTNPISLPLLETIFDLLLALPDLPSAMRLVQRRSSQSPGEKCLPYLMGQAQWRNGDKNEARANYIRVCLLHPDTAYCKRIEIDRAKMQAQQHGVTWIPACGWIFGFLPLISLPENIRTQSEDHQQAVAVYRLLCLSETAMKKNKLQVSIRCRKEIKTMKPDLYEAYFRLLKQRKRKG